MYDYYLGIDGGGTKTDFALSTADGKITDRIILGASNPVDIGIDNTLVILNSGIDLVCKDIPRNKISVFAGLAGASSSDSGNILYRHLKSLGFAAVDTGIDAQNAVAAALGNRDGIAIIMGTGAIALTQKAGTLYRTGGYGYLFGDEGSGFAIGRDAVLAALKDEAGYGNATLITNKVREKCGKKQILDAISAFYRGGKRYLAEFAPIVFDAYSLKDNVARNIIRKNMSGIAELILGASRQFDFDNFDNIDVFLCGGITNRADIILPFIKEALGENSETYNLNICTKPQVYGALVLAGMEEK